mgnify:CR=1 FL=1
MEHETALPLDLAVVDTLSRVTTATLTTVLLKKGLRNVWMRGTRPLQPGHAQAGEEDPSHQVGGGDQHGAKGCSVHVQQLADDHAEAEQGEEEGADQEGGLARERMELLQVAMEIGVEEARAEPRERQLVRVGQEDAEDEHHHQGGEVELLAHGIDQHEDGQDEEELDVVLYPPEQPEQGHGEGGAHHQHTDDLRTQLAESGRTEVGVDGEEVEEDDAEDVGEGRFVDHELLLIGAQARGGGDGHGGTDHTEGDGVRDAREQG